MSKKNQFDDGMLVDQPNMGYYYYPDMFRFPEDNKDETDDMLRPQQPMTPPPPASMSGHTFHSTMVPSGASPVPSGVPTPGGPFIGPTSGVQMEPTLTDIGYTQAFLRTLIGKRVRVSFLIGTNLLVDRVGIILTVGISYIVLRQLDANVDTMCDLYSIKFVDIYTGGPTGGSPTA